MWIPWRLTCHLTSPHSLESTPTHLSDLSWALSSCSEHCKLMVSDYLTSSLDLSFWLLFICSPWHTAKPDLSLVQWMVWVESSPAGHPIPVTALKKGIPTETHKLQSSWNKSSVYITVLCICMSLSVCIEVFAKCTNQRGKSEQREKGWQIGWDLKDLGTDGSGRQLSLLSCSGYSLPT